MSNGAPTVLLPEVIQEEKLLREQIGGLYRQWADVRDAREFWQPVNIRFEHNPEWRNNVWSMQAMADGKGLWKDVKVMTMFMMGGAPFIWAATAVVVYEAWRVLKDEEAEDGP